MSNVSETHCSFFLFILLVISCIFRTPGTSTVIKYITEKNQTNVQKLTDLFCIL